MDISTGSSRSTSALDNSEDHQLNSHSADILSSSPDIDDSATIDGLRDGERKSAFYDYKQEKTHRQTDAKLFFQQQQQHGGSQAGGYNSPIIRASTWASGGNLSRTGSVMSFNSSHHHHSQFSTAHAVDPAISDGKNLNIVVPATGLGTIDKLPQQSEVQGPGMSRFDPHGVLDSGESTSARNPGGAGAAPQTGYVNRDPTLSAELSTIYTNIQKVLDLRHKYLRVSLQGHTDNPKDEPSWKIYPPPPPPVWVDDFARPGDTSNPPHLNESNAAEKSFWAGSGTQNYEKSRKPGHDVGEDFVYDECEIPSEDEMVFRLDDKGVYQVYENKKALNTDMPIVSIPAIREYYMDLDKVLDISSDGPSKSFAFRRLQYLEGRWNLYALLNEHQEMADSKRVPHRDFYNVRKVDTHVHHSASMNQKHLLRFIKSKMKKCPDEVVLFRDGKHLTLAEVFASINLTAYDLSIDTLDMHAHTDSFHRFDKFNLKYNPVGESRLRTIFLKTDNYIKGRYLAELTKEVFADLEASKYQMAEYRISIYGRSEDEWDKLAAWVVDNKLFTHNVRWLIQIPRLYDIYKSTNLIKSFDEVIRNIFNPLFEVTKDPSSHPKLHIFLQRVIGFDSVDDESKPERRTFKKFPTPADWNFKTNPPYSYWIYYLFANTASLNVWRKQRGMNTLVVRPHCGEAGDTDHLAAAVLCCHSISHGILLRKVPLLQYIFYLDQIGIAMSPLSNNALFLAYDKNPFLSYFKRGLNVSLSTDDPLQFAFTKEPLIEEYSVAAQIYKLSAVDMCELARNSVLQSGFEHALKARWLGNDFHLPGIGGNNMDKSNVPNIRISFRHETLQEELAMIDRYTSIQTPATNSAMSLNLSLLPDSVSKRPHSPTTSMQTNPTSIIQDHSTLSQRHSSRKVQTKDGYDTLPSPGLIPKHITGGSNHGNTGDVYNDPHIIGSEPRVWPGVVSSSMRRQPSESGGDSTI
ncbi:hypothetical protein EDC01DRAFT_681312 [Geopyxis carbonaria]|nr:hypothetical protein EDC01DRAFT_681312 [Geopyxis carbonaria]